ncbi:hypothetical protein [Kitasatospora griseola]|uniref:Cupin 2 conserved barrel domain-containing protein n=1 Tax=Kitasatospora griseola TaxID=2064 RepID=A0A0D0PW26_KITGR|nr:hypothetical protein [Kitasatospora griseola]KIQ62753.1 hypothetical protein TR51_27800 [Kitasatospora griseola]
MSETVTRPINVTRLFTDEAGESHFVEEKLDLNEVNFAPPAPSMFLSAPAEARASVYLLCPDGYFGDFHPAPRRQIMTLLQGELEVGVSDGEKRRFLPGGSVLVEDTSGKGHSTRSIGDSLLIVTQL